MAAPADDPAVLVKCLEDRCVAEAEEVQCVVSVQLEFRPGWHHEDVAVVEFVLDPVDCCGALSGEDLPNARTHVLTRGRSNTFPEPVELRPDRRQHITPVVGLLNRMAAWPGSSVAGWPSASRAS